MFNQPLKAFLLTLGGVVIVTGGAYFSGALDRFVVAPPAQLAALPDAASPEPSKPEQPAAVAVPQPADPAKPAEVKAEEQSKPVVGPSFDIVRAEGDGSLVIAGKASPGSVVEIITGSQTLGSAKASADGDFA
ncbi:MAG: peptigoglycan-binding protein LysM, partial [Mesorhizobium sp.]